MASARPVSDATILWRIDDARPRPLRFNGALQPGGHTVYVVGESDSSEDWPRYCVGPLDDSADYQSSTFEVLFDLPCPPDEGAYVLRMAGAEGSGPMPDFEVAIGGERGVGIVRRHRHDRTHAPLPPGPTAGLFTCEIGIPKELLHVGRNALRLSPLGVPPSPDHGPLARSDRRSPGSWFGNTWTWHWLELQRVATASAIDIEAEALPLFPRTCGGDKQLVEVRLRNVGNSTGIQMLIEESTYDLTAAERVVQGDFGDALVQWLVPAVQSATTVEVHVNDHVSSLTLQPTRRWTVHVIPQVHLDLGYTDRQAKITQIHTLNIDRARAIRQSHPDFRFSVDGYYVADAYTRTRRPAAVADLHAESVAGTLGVNAFWCTPLTGLCTREELVRGLYPATAARRQGHTPARSANLTDVPSYTGALPSILAGAGIRRFFGIANHQRGGTADSDELHLISPVRWRGPDGQTVITFFADCYTQLRTVCADQPSVWGMRTGLPRLLQRYERGDYAFSDLPLYGTHADNEDLGSGYADLVDRWNTEFVWPRLRFSTIDDYFDAVEPTQSVMPIVTGSNGSFWEDGAGTVPQVHALHRATQTLLPEAEALWALLTIGSDLLRADTESLDAAWRGVVVGGEHTITAAYGTDAPHAVGVSEQLEWKQTRVADAHARADDAGLAALAHLADQIQLPGLPGLIVFNPLPWARDDHVELELPVGVQLTDSAGHPVGLESTAEPQDGRVRCRARVPVLQAFGYEVLLMTPGRTERATEAAAEDGTVRVGSYDMQFVGGRIRALHHIGTGRDLLDTRAYALGEVLVVDGGGTPEGRGRDDERTSLWDYHPDLAPPLLRETLAEVTGTRVTVDQRGSATIKWEVAIPQVLKGTATLHVDGDQINLDVRLDKQAQLGKQSLYIAFPFAVRGDTLFDRQQGWFRPAEALPGAAMDWFALNNVLLLGEGNDTLAFASRDAALVVFDEPVSGRWRTRFERRTGCVLSWLTNNYWWTNTPASQSGPLVARYRFSPNVDAARAVRMGRELRSDTWISTITVADRRDARSRPRPPRGSLWDVDVPVNVDVSVLNARAVPGATLVRVQEIGGAPTLVHLTAPVCATVHVEECNDVEDVLTGTAFTVSDGAIEVTLHPYEVRSFLIANGHLT